MEDSTFGAGSGAGSGAGTGSAIPSLRRERSNVWDVFRKRNEGGKTKAFCSLCEKSLSYNGSTTSNLRDHLDWHKKQTAKLNPVKKLEPRQMTLDMLTSTGPASSALIRPCAFPKANRITDLLARWCWRNGRPLNIVTDSGLRELVHFLEPGYQFPSCRHISKLIKLSYADAFDMLVKLLNSAATIALTCDGWTSKATDSYVTITAHFISDQWQLLSCVVQCSQFDGSHTGERLAEMMHEAMRRFKIPDHKITVVVHDEAANEVLAGKLLLERYGWKTYVCAAHRLQNAIKYALTRTTKSLANLVRSCRRVVGHFNHSALHKQALVKKQDCARPVTLVQDCATRWNSVFYMIQRLVRLRDAVTSVLGANKDTRHLQLTPSQWDLAVDVVEVLNSLERVTTQLSGELYTTLSCVVPLLYGLYSMLKPPDGDRGAVKAMKKKLRKELEKRFGFPEPDPTSLPLIAAALDPRFRKMKFISSAARTAVREQLVGAASAGTLSGKCSPETPVSSSEKIQEPPAKRVKLEDSFLKSLLHTTYAEGSGSESQRTCESDDDQDESVEEEVSRYMSGKNVEFSSNPLQWWQAQSSNFPRLAVLAKEVLAVPATSAPAERVFSLSGLITDKRRCGLKPELVNALVFLHRNAKVLGLVQEDPVQVLPLQPLFSPPPAVNDDEDEPQLPQLYDLAAQLSTSEETDSEDSSGSDSVDEGDSESD